MSKKLTIEQMQEIAKSRGGKCLSKEYINNHTKLKWGCKEGHEWYAQPNKVKFGSWCSDCSDKRKLTIEQMQELAKSRGGKCLSKKYVNTDTKLAWECREGHSWFARPDSVKNRGHWCPYCAGRHKLTIKDMQELAKSQSGKCLSKNYVSNHTKLKWKCKEDHEWYARPSSVKRGHWCPYCARKHITIEEIQKLAKLKGGKCLSKEYFTGRTKMKWRCKEGHEWETAPNNIRSGRWCPLCSQRVSERICRGFFETIFQKKFPTLKPTWLINSRGNRMELDGYSKDLGLAFEYHGIQHYNVGRFFIKEKDELEQRKKDDKLKIQLCKKNNVVLIEIPYTVSYEEMDDYIIKKCKERKVSVPEITKKIDYKLLDVYSPQRLREMKDLAKIRGGWCLSKRYINKSTKLKWKCAEGHIWEATPGSVKNKSSWCLKCSGSAKSTIEQMQKLAKLKGGECLSKKYIESHAKLKWRCKEGHEWESASHSIKRGHWCQKCWYQRSSFTSSSSTRK